MMNCDKAKQLLSDYLDNTLEPGVKKEIDDFLKSSEECNKIFDDAKLLQSQLKSLPGIVPSEEFEINLRNRIIELNNTGIKQAAFNKKGFSLAFSGVVLVAALYMFVFTDAGPQQNISDEILPSSTIINSKPSVSNVDNNLVADQEKEDEQAVEQDSLNNIPEKIDNSGIHLTGDAK